MTLRSPAHALALTLALVAALMGCSNTVLPSGGLMLVMRSDGTLSPDRLHVDITSVDGTTTYRNADYAIPSEVTFPTTLAIASDGDPNASVAISVSVWSGETPLDIRQDQAFEVPTDRVAELDIVFSAACTPEVTESNGQAVSKCPNGQTCDPRSGSCVGDTVQSGSLPTFVSSDGGSSQIDAFVDARVPDAESPRDAGNDSSHRPDANVDSSLADAGKDSTTVADSGQDSAMIDSAALLYSIGGNVNGLAANQSVILRNGSDQVTVSANGTFVFADGEPSGQSYDVTVLTQPTNPALFCGVTGGAGTVMGAAVTDVVVSCAVSNFMALAAGEGHACAVTTGGSVSCWGENDSGQLGNGSTTDSNVPTPITGLSNVTAIAAGGSQTCAVLEGGSVDCWGNGATVPTPVPGAANVASLAVGVGSVCALLTGGTVECWGENLAGELGNGSSSPSNTPVPVTGLSSVTSISMTSEHACAVSGGTVTCWGDNADGQLGNGSMTASNVPVAVPGPTGVIAVAAGRFHSCALLSAGTMECWGWNDWGQIGDGTSSSTANVLSPAMVSGLTNATSITANDYNTCAVLNGGTLDCWGANLNGSLGDNSQAPADAPVMVLGLSGVTAVAGGGLFTCALASNGIECWGWNGYGQLGAGAPFQANTPSAVSGLGGPVAGVGAGTDHTCALLKAGTVDCWGDNSSGELGNGNPAITQAPSPVVVTGLGGATAIATGQAHTCVVVANGAIECWGWNAFGQLGNGGTPTQSDSPVPVTGITGATAVSAGFNFACARLSSGGVQCWGDNTDGQLGNGTVVKSDVPVPVTGLSGATAIATGGYHACAIIAGGAVQCWGSNSYGQLGDGTMTQRTTPVAVAGLAGVTAIAASGSYTCAVLANATVSCWGLYDSTSPATAPTGIGGLSGIMTIAAGGGNLGPPHTCALSTSGSVQCWGTNHFGELGNGTNTDSTIPVTAIASGASGVYESDTTACAVVTGGTLECWGWSGDSQLGQGWAIEDVEIAAPVE